MRIRWTPAAAADLQSISDYLKEHHPRYHDPILMCVKCLFPNGRMNHGTDDQISAVDLAAMIRAHCARLFEAKEPAGRDCQPPEESRERLATPSRS